MLAGYSWTTSPQVWTPPGNRWWLGESRCLFYRLENIDEGPDPADIRIAWLPDDETGFWQGASQSSLAGVWDNAEDDVYARLLDQ